MKLSKLQLYEGQKVPWWGRPWRYDYIDDYTYVLPIPVCWLARLAWNLWCFSFKYRRNAWEWARQDAWRTGYKAGIDAGMVKSGQQGEVMSQGEIIIYLTAMIEAATELRERMARLSGSDEAEE